MPDVTASGPVSIAVEAMRTLISNLSFFQTLTGTGSAAAALAQVFSGEVGYRITSFTGGVAGATTVMTSRPTMIHAGDIVTIEGASCGPQSEIDVYGAVVVESVVTDGFVIATTIPNGTILYPKFAFVVPVPRPIAVVCESESSPLRGASVGTGGASVLSGSIDILLEADVSASYVNDPKNAPMEARNTAGGLVQALIQNQGTGDLMLLNTVELVSVEFTSHTEQDDGTVRYERWRALIRTTWGLDG